MTLIDFPEKWIIKMFRFNQRETGGENAAYFEGGIGTDQFPLREGERIYGQLDTEDASYLFTPLRLAVLGLDKTDVFWRDIIRCNGSFRSSHQQIRVEISTGQVVTIPIAHFPYRLQQLFYQMLERHGSLLRESIFKASNRLQDFLVKPTPEEALLLPDKEDTDQRVAKVAAFGTDQFRIAYVGAYDAEEDFIYPDTKGDLLVCLVDADQNNITLFDARADGYNAVVENPAVIARKDSPTAFLSEAFYRVFAVYHYSFEDTEYEDLLEGIQSKDFARLNDLFTNVTFYKFDRENRVTIITTIETA